MTVLLSIDTVLGRPPDDLSDGSTSQHNIAAVVVGSSDRFVTPP